MSVKEREIHYRFPGIWWILDSGHCLFIVELACERAWNSLRPAVVDGGLLHHYCIRYLRLSEISSYITFVFMETNGLIKNVLLSFLKTSAYMCIIFGIAEWSRCYSHTRKYNSRFLCFLPIEDLRITSYAKIISYSVNNKLRPVITMKCICLPKESFSFTYALCISKQMLLSNSIIIK